MAGSNVVSLASSGAPSPQAGGATDFDDDENYLSIEKLRRQYLDYLGTKSAEIEEQKDARRYYHCSQWTAEEIAVLKDRHQPVVTYNLIGRKIDGIVGVIGKLKKSPKAYARTPQHQAGSDLASAAIRYVLDSSDWKSKRTRTAHFGAVDGIAGVEYDLQKGDEGDPDLKLHLVYPDTFFYDPRSYDEGFTDARFMGVSKWTDAELAKELCPGKEEEIENLVEAGTDLTTNAAREVAWVNTTQKRVRLIDHWYIKNGEWRWCLYIGTTKLMGGISPFTDENGKTFSKYRMFSAYVDQDGDRYGPIRNLKSPQDEVNHRLSKSMHLLNSRRVIASKGAVDDVEVARREYAKSDGWIEKNPGAEIETDDQRAMADMRAHAELMKGAKDYIQNFGPGPALVGEGLQDSSGRAISLLQQAALAELGPYLSAFQNFEVRIYRDIFDIVSKHWTSERWLRVTDDDGLAQFFQINQMQIDQYGRPEIVNALGSIDVDFILDEGPDTINMQADAYGILQSLGPQFIQEFPDIAIDLAPLENSIKKKMLDKIKAQQSAPPKPDPKVQAMQAQVQLEMQSARAKLEIDHNSAQQKMALDAQHNAAQIQFMREKTAADIEAKQQQAALDRELEIERMALEDRKDQRKHMVALHNAHADREAAASLQNGEHKVSESISFKDLPPDGKQQMARQAGLDIAPPPPDLDNTNERPVQ